MLPTKRTLIRILVIGIALMFGLLITVFLKYREFAENPAKLVDAIPEGADIAIGEIRHTSVKDGRKEWSLEAASANYSNSTKEALFTDVQVIFFLENNREVMVKGQQGRLKTDTNDIQISGDVIVRDADYALAAEKLNYDHVHRKIDIAVPVKITGRTFELQANQMTVDLSSETALLRGAVNGLFHGNDIPLL
jgi:LPS export ABC transporter protein LptC